jgi:hypothetical protein
MAILANRRPRTRRSHVRSICLLAGFDPDGKNAVVRITQDGRATDYHLDQLAVDFWPPLASASLQAQEARQHLDHVLHG